MGFDILTSLRKELITAIVFYGFPIENAWGIL